jgi:predicted ester cyclase
VADNRKLVARFYDEVLNAKRTEILDEIVAPDFAEHGTPPIPPGIDAFRGFVHQVVETFPDFEFTVDDWIVDGDRVVVRGSASGTHGRAFLGFEPTGTRVAWTAIHIWRVADGKLAERWSEANVLGIIEQLRNA